MSHFDISVLQIKTYIHILTFIFKIIKNFNITVHMADVTDVKDDNFIKYGYCFYLARLTFVQ
jgi:hypothetical protein